MRSSSNFRGVSSLVGIDINESKVEYVAVSKMWENNVPLQLENRRMGRAEEIRLRQPTEPSFKRDGLSLKFPA